jgi:hypothetical protein
MSTIMKCGLKGRIYYQAINHNRFHPDKGCNYLRPGHKSNRHDKGLQSNVQVQAMLKTI